MEKKSVKKSILTLIIAVLAAGSAFAERGPNIFAGGLGLGLGIITFDANSLTAEPAADSEDAVVEPEASAAIYPMFALPAVGLQVSYEHMVSPRLALALEAGFQSAYYIISAVDIAAHVRFYPTESFFVGAGAGYGLVSAMMAWSAHCVFVSPQAGWIIDIGAPGGTVLIPSAGINMYFLLGQDYPVNIFEPQIKIALGHTF
jgi:hypothetical protein